MKEKALATAKLAVVALAFAYLARSGAFSLSRLEFRPGAISMLGLAVLFGTGTLIAGAIRMWTLAGAFDRRPPLTRFLAINFIGAFFDNFLLGSSGGDAVRVLYIGRETSAATALGLTLTDRIVGLLGLVLVGAGALALAGPELLSRSELATMAWALAAVVLVSVAALAVLASGILAPVVERIGIYVPVRRPALLAGGVFLSVVVQLINASGLWAVGAALAGEPTLSLAQIARAAPPALVANALPLPGGGIGVGEAAFGRCLELFVPGLQHGAARGAAIFLLMRVVSLVVGLIGLPFYLRRRGPAEGALPPAAGVV